MTTPKAQLASLTYNDLHTADPIELRERIYDRIANVDASNWQEVLESFTQITRNTGRQHYAEWKMMIFRIGQVAGSDAMEKWRRSGLHNWNVETTQTMYGWSMADPDAALAWLENLAPEEAAQWNKLLPTVIGGAALNDPHRAMDLMASLSAEDKNRSISQLSWNLINQGGLDTANQWVDRVMQEEGGDPAYQRRVLHEVATRAVESAAYTLTPGRVVRWFERFQDAPVMDQELVGSMVLKFGGTNSLGALEFLVGVSDMTMMQGHAEQPPQLHEAIRRSYRHSPAKVEAWLKANRDVPFYDAAMEVYDSMRQPEE